MIKASSLTKKEADNGNIKNIKGPRPFCPSYNRGDGVSWREFSVGKQTGQACINECVKRRNEDLTINGVTVRNFQACWCEKKMARMRYSKNFMTCYIGKKDSEYNCPNFKKKRDGTGSGADEVFIGDARNIQDCIDKCKSRQKDDPTINGVSMVNPDKPGCYCEKKMKSIKHDLAYKSCFLHQNDYVTTSCGGQKSSSGLIRYPPSGNYFNNKDCTWTVDTGGMPFTLVFHRFHLESHDKCKSDYLQINGKETYCGSQKPPSVYSSTGKMKLVFHSDVSVKHTGFLAEIRMRYITTTCGGTLSSGMIHYPASGKYEHQEDCKWTIDTGGMPFTLRFHRFHLETHGSCDNDFVQIDGGAKHCGNTKPQDVTSSSGRMSLLFHSNGSVAKTGFSAEIVTTDGRAVDVAEIVQSS